nr:unnamed protein product [Spirometra erinaceieuropaei]
MREVQRQKFVLITAVLLYYKGAAHLSCARSDRVSVYLDLCDCFKMLSCPFLKKAPAAFFQKEPQTLLTTALRCPFAQRVLSQLPTEPVRTVQTAAATEKCERPYPPVCDTVSDCILKKCPYAGQVERCSSLRSVDESRQPPVQTEFGGTRIPTTCALFPCSNQYAPKPIYVTPVSPTASAPKMAEKRQFFDFDGFFADQIDKKRSTSTYRVFRRILRDANEYPFADEFSNDERRRITVWCSNDYLGMSRHPKVQESARNAIRRFGVGSGGTRNISGNSLLHEALEHELADLHGKEAALVFSSCYVANEATLYTLGTSIPDLQILSDAGNHASMIHGIRTSRAAKHIYRHNDPNHLKELIRKMPPELPKLVAFETVHSMTGGICPITELLEVTQRHNALSFVDEVHAVGLYGQHGAGVAEEVGCMSQINAITGTLGKAFASFGGYLAGSRLLVDMLRSYASGFIFTTSLPPPVLAAARASIAILRSSEGQELRAEHRRRVAMVRNRLFEAGLPVVDVPSHIIPVRVGNAALCTRVSEDLLWKHGIYIQSINYPTVPKGSERLRIAPSPFHTDELTDKLIDALVSVWRENGLPLAV